MKIIQSSFLSTLLLVFIITTSCHSSHKQEIDITPHPVNPGADSLYQQALSLLQSSYDVDSTHKCIRLLDEALQIDSFNPDYYGTKAKLLSELGELDSALSTQTLAMKKNAITGEYLFQLGLFQSAKDMYAEAHESFGKSRDFLQVILKQYPDSLGAFILAEAANALYQKEDSLFMRDIEEIRRRFPQRLLEIEMTRRVKPHSLIRQIKNIQMNKEYNIDFDMDSLVNEAVRENEKK